MCVCWYLFDDNILPFAIRLKRYAVSTDVPNPDAKGHDFDAKGQIMNQILRQ
jgi:hypothetical protein